MAVPAGRDIKPNENDSVRYYPGYKECLDAVNSGEAHYTRMPASFVEDLLSKDFYSNISLVADVNEKEELTLALPVPIDVTLYSILSKAINNLSTDELNSILTQNVLTVRETSATLKSLLYSNPVMVISVCVGMVYSSFRESLC